MASLRFLYARAISLYENWTDSSIDCANGFYLSCNLRSVDRGKHRPHFVLRTSGEKIMTAVLAGVLALALLVYLLAALFYPEKFS